MTFPTYEEWGEKVAEQVIDVYLINGRTIREWIEILSDELTILDKIKVEIEQAADKQFQIAMGVSDLNERYAHIQMENAYRYSLNVIDKYRGDADEMP